MKHNLAPHLSWLLKERPFAALNRGDDPLDIALLAPIKPASAQSTNLHPILPSPAPDKRPETSGPASVQQSRSQPTSFQLIPKTPKQGEVLVRPAQAHSDGDSEEMARLRIEPKPKRPKLNSALATPGASFQSSVEAPSSEPETPDAKAPRRHQVTNPYRTYSSSNLTAKVKYLISLCRNPGLLLS